MAANNIALMPLQREGGVDSYLSALAQGQQLKQQRDAGTRAQAQEQRAQTDFDMQRKLQAVDQLGAALDGIQDGDAQGFERVKAFAVQNGLIDPNEAQRYTVEQLPQIRALSQRARTIAKERQQAEMQAQQFDLNRRATEANIRQSDASAAASRASAARTAQGPGKAPNGYAWSADGSALVPLPGGPADPARKLTETQSKDLAYYRRGTQANNALSDDRIEAMTSAGNSLARGVLPGALSNAAQSDASRQGMQAARDFIAAILRKDTGAAVTPQEFDFYADIFLPQFGDDARTKQQKAESRKQALESIKAGLGGAQSLTEGGPQPVAPQAAGGQYQGFSATRVE